MNATTKSAGVASTEVDCSSAAFWRKRLYRVSTDAAGLCRDIVVATARNIQGRKLRVRRRFGRRSPSASRSCAASSA